MLLIDAVHLDSNKMKPKVAATGFLGQDGKGSQETPLPPPQQLSGVHWRCVSRRVAGSLLADARGCEQPRAVARDC